MNSEQQQSQMHKMVAEMCGMSMEECQAMMAKMMGQRSETEDAGLSDRNRDFAAPELRGLFFEWANQILSEMKDYMKSHNTDELSGISKHFNLSTDSCKYLLNELQ